MPARRRAPESTGSGTRRSAVRVRLNLLNLRGLTDGDVEGVIGTLDPAGIAHVEGALASLSRQEAPMPRRKSLVTMIRDMVREQVQEAIQGLLGAVAGPKKKAKNGRRRRRRRRRGPGRPPGSKNKA